MSLNSKLISEFDNVKLKRSKSGKEIIKFEKSEASNFLYRFLVKHPSIRVIFNSLIKTGFIDLDSSLKNLQKMLSNAETSFTYIIKCDNCDHILEKPHIIDLISKDYSKNYRCPNCKKINKIDKKQYLPDYSPDRQDLLKVLFQGCKDQVFQTAYVFECMNCNIFTPPKENSKFNSACSKCRQQRYLSTEFQPLYKELEDISSNKQGYWLEWYVWRLIKNNFISDIGLQIISNSVHFEGDVIFLNQNKKYLIECKDTSDDNYLKKLHDIGDIFDYFILVTTQTLHKDSIKTAKKILKNKFLLVNSKDIENLVNLIKKLK